MAIEGDGFYASVFPSGSEQPTGKRFLNASVIEAFFAVQQAEVVLADAVSAWDRPMHGQPMGP